MQPQAVTENIDAARRDSRLLRMAFRRARQAGDYRGALQASQLGDQMGLQIGTPVRDEAIKGLGMRRYQDKMRMDQIASGSLGSEPGMQPQQQQLGVGGYDFNQRVGSPLARPQGVQQTTPDQLRRAVMQRRWQMAKTQEEKDAITEQAAAQGLTSNPSAVQDALMRRRKNFGVPNVSDMGGQGVAAPPSETIPLRPNSQIGGPPSGEVMKGYEEYKPGAGGWIRPIKTGIGNIAAAGQYIQERQAGRDAIEQQYQQKRAGLESLRPNYSRFQRDLERGYNETVETADMTSSKVAGALGMGSLPPDESMRQTFLKSRGNQRSRQFKSLSDIYGNQQKPQEFSDKRMQMDEEKENYLNNQRRRNKSFMLGPSGPLTFSRP